MNQRLETHDDNYGDSDFLAYRDIAIDDFRKSKKESKIQIIKKMIELRHNVKYNKHLLSVYLKAKSLFDNMVDEHRSQITYLEEIYHHINNMIRENHSRRKSNIMTELLKDKKRIGMLLKNMRNSYEKLTNVYTVLDVTVQKMNEMIVSLEEAEAENDADTDADTDADADAEPGSEFDLELDENEQEYVENYNNDNEYDDEYEDEDEDEDEDDDEDDDEDEDEDEYEDEDEDEYEDEDEDEDDDEYEDDKDEYEDEDEDDEENAEDDIQLNRQTKLHDIENEDDDPELETTDPQERFIMVF